ncbi:hypothetical protein ACTXT7_003126 [Hymenolepis weldensis]
MVRVVKVKISHKSEPKAKIEQSLGYLLSTPSKAGNIRVHSATSTTSFTAEMMVQRLVEQRLFGKSKLPTFNTHHGLYQHARLQFGVKTAPTIFSTNNEYRDIEPLWFCCIPRRHKCNKPPSTERAIVLLQLIQKYGFRLQTEKFTFSVLFLKYLGQKWPSLGPRKASGNCRNATHYRHYYI